MSSSFAPRFFCGKGAERRLIFINLSRQKNTENDSPLDYTENRRGSHRLFALYLRRSILNSFYTTFFGYQTDFTHSSTKESAASNLLGSFPPA